MFKRMRRRFRRRGNFLTTLLINLLLNFDGLLPAIILLVLHFWLDISIWWFVGAIILWMLSIAAWIAFIGFAISCSDEKDPPKENKNPYSNRNNIH